ncbi:MAG: sugar fermentation stimulation protein SfsA, partial [Lachnospiraceae bacterium]
MNYERVVEAVFLNRPNRFIAQVLVEGREETVHVKNTGRLKELLIPGVHVWVQHHDNPDRKTKYSLITVEKSLENGETAFVNIDSQAPNQAAEEWLRHGADGIVGEISLIRR